MMKASIEHAADYPRLVKALTYIGWLFTIAAGLANYDLGLLILVVFFGVLPITMLVAIRSEQMSYAPSFRRSWVDWVLENTNNLLLIGGVATAIYGFLESFLFGILAGFMYIVTISLTMDISWKISRLCRYKGAD